jgi:hypothetical protein
MSDARPTLAGLTSIKILGKVYSIKDNADLIDLGVSGRVNVIKNIIQIRPDMSLPEKAETLFHEIIHACDNSVAPEDSVLTETQVMRLSAVLYATLVDAGLLKAEDPPDEAELAVVDGEMLRSMRPCMCGGGVK